jgi:hypothetical protein
VTALLVWLGALVVMAAGVALIGRRRKLQHDYVRQRTERHEVLLYHLANWIDDDGVVTVARQQGVMSSAGLRALHLKLSGPTKEPELRAYVGALLQSRPVRQAIAKHMHRRHGTKQADAMRMLMGFADMYRELPPPPKPEEASR